MLQTIVGIMRRSSDFLVRLQVATLNTTDLLAGGWRRRCLLLVMPGGADLPYCCHLNGTGNALISGGF